MKVLLIQPAAPAGGDTLPINLMYIAAYLRGKGISTRVIDASKHDLPDDKPELVGIGALTLFAENALALVQTVRRCYPNAKIALGGRHFTYLPEEGKEADAVVVGEGERTLLNMCNNGIREGIVYGEELASLDEIPFPDDDLLDVVYAGRKTRLHVIGARGCPFNCVFCGEHSRKVRYHNTEYFVDLLERISKRYHNDIFISDDLFTINKKRAYAICEEIIRRKLDLKIRVFGHIKAFDKDLYMVMKQAGVWVVSYGIESGNDNILKLINKGFTTDQAYEVIQETKATGLQINCLYMIGNIGETRETIMDTINFSRRVKSNARWFSYAMPLPGSMFYKVASNYGTVIKRPWSDYNNQNILFVPNGMSLKDIEGLMRLAQPEFFGETKGFMGQLNTISETFTDIRNRVKTFFAS